jgi:hypothetical protein
MNVGNILTFSSISLQTYETQYIEKFCIPGTVSVDHSGNYCILVGKTIRRPTEEMCRDSSATLTKPKGENK